MTEELSLPRGQQVIVTDESSSNYLCEGFVASYAVDEDKRAWVKWTGVNGGAYFHPNYITPCPTHVPVSGDTVTTKEGRTGTIVDQDGLGRHFYRIEFPDETTVCHILDLEQPKQPEGNCTMEKQLKKNKAAAILATRITAGKAINTKAMELIKPKLPLIARGYADHPLGKVVLANIAGVALQQYAPQSKRANQVADLMLEAAALQAVEEFNIDEILMQLLDGISLPEALTETD